MLEKIHGCAFENISRFSDFSFHFFLNATNFVWCCWQITTCEVKSQHNLLIKRNWLNAHNRMLPSFCIAANQAEEPMSLWPREHSSSSTFCVLSISVLSHGAIWPALNGNWGRLLLTEKKNWAVIWRERGCCSRVYPRTYTREQSAFRDLSRDP